MRATICCGLGACALFLAGCGSSDRWKDARPTVYPAGGTVLFDGKPVEGALVVYQSPDAKFSAQGRTDANGAYQLTTFEEGDGAVAGTHKIVVRKIEHIEKRTKYDSPDEPSIAKIAVDRLPKKYSAPLSTDLSALVSEDSENHAELKLTK